MTTYKLHYPVIQDKTGKLTEKKTCKWDHNGSGEEEISSL